MTHGMNMTVPMIIPDDAVQVHIPCEDGTSISRTATPGQPFDVPASAVVSNLRAGWRFAPAFGATAARPVKGLCPGVTFFDTTLNKPVWWTGSGWVDATGTPS